MKYVFKIDIYTDGDFGFPYVPRGMSCDDGYRYTLEKSYIKEDKAIDDVRAICAYLKEQIHTSRDYVKESWDRCVDEFIKQIDEFDKNEHRTLYSCMYGNYEGTEISFYTEDDYITCGFYATDEEIELFKNHEGVTNEMVKEAVLNLFRNKKEK